MVGNIGFSGSSIKKNDLVIPAMQVVLGGGTDPSGQGWIAEKVIKLPTKKILDGIRALLNDYDQHATEGEYYNDYYRRQGKKYFYELLKPLANIELLSGTDLFDWGQDHEYKQEIGVGECAAVVLDLVGTIIKDASERLEEGKEELKQGNFSEAAYFAYSTRVIAAKALLLADDISCNTQINIINDFQEKFVEAGKLSYTGDFREETLAIKKQEPTEAFVNTYLANAEAFLKQVLDYRAAAANGAEDKEVIGSYYKA